VKTFGGPTNLSGQGGGPPISVVFPWGALGRKGWFFNRAAFNVSTAGKAILGPATSGLSHMGGLVKPSISGTHTGKPESNPPPIFSWHVGEGRGDVWGNGGDLLGRGDFHLCRQTGGPL